MYRRTTLITIVILVFVVAAIVFWPRRSQAPTQPTNNGNTAQTNTNSSTNTNTNSASVVFTTADEPDSLSHFSFSTRLPKGWISQYDSSNTMILFSPLSAGQADSGDTIVAVTRLSGSTWPAVSGATSTSRTIGGHAAKEWSGVTVTAEWHDRFDGWHRGEPMRQLDWQVTSGAQGLYYRLTGGPGVTDTDWKLIRDALTVIK